MTDDEMRILISRAGTWSEKEQLTIKEELDRLRNSRDYWVRVTDSLNDQVSKLKQDLHTLKLERKKD